MSLAAHREDGALGAVVSDGIVSAEAEQELLVGVSGIRGIVGAALTDSVAHDVAVAFARVHCRQWGRRRRSFRVADDVVVADDGRPSGAELRRAVLAGLTLGGVRGIDLGTCPTPVVKGAVARGAYAGGVIVTASHNPQAWNGLKLVRSDGQFLSEAEGMRVIEASAVGRRRAIAPETGAPVAPEAPVMAHRADLIRAVDADRIRRAGFRVAVDACNASASDAAPALLRELGCEVVEVFCDGSGFFPREAEPLPEHLGALSEAVRSEGAAVGFALDPDGDRCALVAEDGRVPSEECTLALCVSRVLERMPGTVVLNTATSYMAEALAGRKGCRVVRAPVGEVHVTDAMLALEAVIGGEGNGGVIWPPVGHSRDGLAAMALVLDLLAVAEQPLSALLAALPPSRVVKRKVPVSPPEREAALGRMAAAYTSFVPEPIPDGRKWWLGERGAPPWLLARASRTESVVRIIVESAEEEEAMRLADEAERYLQVQTDPHSTAAVAAAS
jgi:phosphomannomutase